MAKRNIYEVFDEFQNYAGNRPAQVALLRHYENTGQAPVRDVLLGAFHPFLMFDTEVPEYKASDLPPGMSYQNMHFAIGKSYLFMANDPRRAKNLTPERRKQLLQQILESLEAREAEVFANMLRKDLKIPGLTKELAVEAFPDLLS